MKDEIKEIIENVKKCCDITKEQSFTVYQRQDILKLLDCINNLQEENEFLKLNNPEMNMEHFRIIKENKRKIDNLRKENERLKEKLNCKEYFSSTMPENTEFVILTKENYDRQQKDIELELIDYKSRNEKAIEYLANCDWNCKDFENLYDILNGGDDKDE